jgi:hypothetical protein
MAATLSFSGTPPSSVTVGGTYAYRPVLTNTTGSTPGWGIANKPSWATFNYKTGELTGKPTSADVGTYSNIQIAVGAGTIKYRLPSTFSITVKASTSNTAPTISGTPSTSVKIGSAYSFKPTARISNKPSWASFSVSTGLLSGTPSSSNFGTYSNIGISVSDGKGGSKSLPAFSIAVTSTTTTATTATLSWIAPATTTSGQPLVNLAGYRVYYGSSSSSLSTRIQVSSAGAISQTISNLGKGTWYFAVSAYTTDGVEGPKSSVVSKTIL